MVTWHVDVYVHVHVHVCVCVCGGGVDFFGSNPGTTYACIGAWDFFQIQSMDDSLENITSSCLFDVVMIIANL
jgi:hypothetical protein